MSLYTHLSHGIIFFYPHLILYIKYTTDSYTSPHDVSTNSSILSHLKKEREREKDDGD